MVLLTDWLQVWLKAFFAAIFEKEIGHRLVPDNLTVLDHLCSYVKPFLLNLKVCRFKLNFLYMGGEC